MSVQDNSFAELKLRGRALILQKNYTERIETCKIAVFLHRMHSRDSISYVVGPDNYSLVP
jgi:hypothetical protein